MLAALYGKATRERGKEATLSETDLLLLCYAVNAAIWVKQVCHWCILVLFIELISTHRLQILSAVRRSGSHCNLSIQEVEARDLP